MSAALDAAVAAASRQDQAVPMRQVTIPLSAEGRVALLMVPVDLKPGELFGLIGVIALEMPKQLRAAQTAPARRIVVPT